MTTYNVNSGQSVANTVLNFADSENVSYGGIAANTTINSGGYQYISGGGTAGGAKINNGGYQYISAGGTASGTTVNSGGSEIVYYGGIAISSMVNSGGYEVISAGGTVSGGKVASGGEILGLVISSGSFVDNANQSSQVIDTVTIQSGGIIGLSVDSGAATQGFVISNGGFEVISSGGSASGTIINSGGYEQISAGGMVSGGVVSAGGEIYGLVLSSGAYTYSANQASHVIDGVTIQSGGIIGLFVDSGASTQGLVVSSGGFETINNGAIASGTTINSGGYEQISAGGMISGGNVASGGGILGLVISSGNYIYSANQASHVIDGVTIQSGGIIGLSVNSGAATLGFVISSGGYEVISYGGTASATIINSGGYEVVSSGGMVAGGTVASGGMLGLVLSSGSYTFTANQANLVLDGVTIHSGGILGLSVESGVSTQGFEASSSGYQVISYGGTANGAIINNGGYQVISNGGIASGSIINSGGFEYVNVGGVASGTTLNNGGSEVISNGGTAVSATLNNGGYQVISSGGTAISATINSGGYQVISSGGIASATTINSGGQADILSGGSAIDATLKNGAELILHGNNLAGVSINNGAMLDFAGITANAAGLNAAGQLQVSENGTVLEILGLSGNNGNDTFTTQSDSEGGTLVLVKALPVMISVSYNAGGGQLSLLGVNLTTVATNYQITDFSLKGDGGASYTLTSGSTVFGTPSSTAVTLQLSNADQLAVDGLLNKNGNQANDGSTIYNLSAGSGWDSGAAAITTQAVSVSNVTAPTINAVAYNAATGVFTISGAHLDNHGSSNGIAIGDFKLTGGVSGSYNFSSAHDSISNLSATGFTVTLSSSDKAAVNAIVNTNGNTPSSGAAYNLVATTHWDSDSGAAISSQAVKATGIPATLNSVSYNAAGGLLSLSGANLSSSAAAYVVSDLTIKGDGGASYTLTNGSLVTGAPNSAGVTIQLSGADQLAVDGLLNKNGVIANDGISHYNLSANGGWENGAGAISTQAVSVSNVIAPTLSAVAYNVAGGVFTISGAHLDNHGSTNGIVLNDFKLTIGSSSFNLNSSDSISHLTAGGFAITLSSSDKTTVNALVNDNGTQSLTGTAYHLAASVNWDSDAGAAFTAQAVTVSGLDIFNSKLTGSPLVISNLLEGSGQIELSKTIFTAFAGDAAVTAANFSNAVGAGGSKDYLYYNANNGGLYYDADGSGTHSSGVEIAVIGVGSHPTALSVADFKLIA